MHFVDFEYMMLLVGVDFVGFHYACGVFYYDCLYAVYDYIKDWICVVF